jgi:hypothetical protein
VLSPQHYIFNRFGLSAHCGRKSRKEEQEEIFATFTQLYQNTTYVIEKSTQDVGFVDQPSKYALSAIPLKSKNLS